jgi:hypothetical protein
LEQIISSISRVKALTFEIGPMGCSEKPVKTTTALCVMTLKSVVFIYFAADDRSYAGGRNLFPLCGNCLRFYWVSAEKPVNGQYILSELYS